MAIMDLTELDKGDVVSADPECWTGVDLTTTPDVAYTDVQSVDELVPAPEEAPECGS